MGDSTKMDFGQNIKHYSIILFVRFKRKMDLFTGINIYQFGKY